jgi:uroporphyrinogen-III synthase
MRQRLLKRTVLVTRDREGNRELAKKLRAGGCCVVCWETFRCVAEPPSKKLQKALHELDRFDWIVFTSPRAVKFFIGHIGLIRPIRHIKIAVVGLATAKVARSHGFKVAQVAKIATAKGLAAERVFQRTEGLRIFFPKASDARDDFREVLKRKHKITSCVVYRKKFIQHAKSQVQRLLNQKIDRVVFYSPSAILAMARELGRQAFVRLIGGCQVHVKGETTRQALHNFLRPVSHNVARESC